MKQIDMLLKFQPFTITNASALQHLDDNQRLKRALTVVRMMEIEWPIVPRVGEIIHVARMNFRVVEVKHFVLESTIEVEVEFHSYEGC